MNTPETDKAERMAYSGEYMVPTEFARQLERERDEALRHLEEIKEYGTEEINAAVELRQKLAAALVERDEAREQVKNLEDQRDLCMKTICRLEKELDQIRAVFGHGANDADWKPGTTIAEAVEKVMRERNEARKLACLYKDQFYAVSMPTVKPPKFSWEEGYIQ